MSKYKKWDQPSEATALLVGYIFDMYGVEGLLNGNFVGDEKIAKLAAAIQNYFKNGEEETTDGNTFGRKLGSGREENNPRDGVLHKPGRETGSENGRGGDRGTVAEGDRNLYRDDEEDEAESYDAGGITPLIERSPVLGTSFFILRVESSAGGRVMKKMWGGGNKSMFSSFKY